MTYSGQIGWILDHLYNWRQFYDVRNDGVIADGVTDDTAALQRALDNSDGRPFYIPGLIAVQPNTIVMPAGAVLIGMAPPSQRYLAADIVAAVPSYDLCSGIQLVAGTHGALFKCESQTPASEPPDSRWSTSR